MGVRVVTDSACDLPVDRAEELGIEIVPLTIRFGDEEFVDREELTNEEFWRKVATSDVLPGDRGAVGRRVRGDVPPPRRRGRRRDRLHQPLVAPLGDDAVRPGRRQGARRGPARSRSSTR